MGTGPVSGTSLAVLAAAFAAGLVGVTVIAPRVAPKCPVTEVVQNAAQPPSDTRAQLANLRQERQEIRKERARARAEEREQVRWRERYLASETSVLTSDQTSQEPAEEPAAEPAEESAEEPTAELEVEAEPEPEPPQALEEPEYVEPEVAYENVDEIYGEPWALSPFGLYFRVNPEGPQPVAARPVPPAMLMAPRESYTPPAPLIVEPGVQAPSVPGPYIPPPPVVPQPYIPTPYVPTAGGFLY